HWDCLSSLALVTSDRLKSLLDSCGFAINRFPILNHIAITIPRRQTFITCRETWRRLRVEALSETISVAVTLGLARDLDPLFCLPVTLAFNVAEYQLADLFTKALPVERFQYLVRRLGMRCLTPAELEALANESA
nr:ribonuclease H-like domain-containing protein [Tanacetum cinerariifolium]